jgi:hypothetical protein
LIAIVISSSVVTYAQAFSPTPVKAVGTLLLKSGKVELALPASKIEELARVASKPGGTKEVGDELARMNLPNEVLEDTFARILIVQGRVPEREAEGWMRRLSGVDGFRAAMRKSMGASDANTIGHLNEVRIADSAAQENFKIRGIGVKFTDPNKTRDTDIDVLLERRGQLIAIEAKAYPSNAAIPMDGFRADMLSLLEYQKANPTQNIVTVFSLTNKPVNPDTWKLLQSAADHYKVELLVGSPEELVHQLSILLR